MMQGAGGCLISTSGLIYRICEILLARPAREGNGGGGNSGMMRVFGISMGGRECGGKGSVLVAGLGINHRSPPRIPIQ